MKRLTFILIICFTTQILIGQAIIEKVWLTEYLGDSLTQEKFLVRISFDKNNTNYRIEFDQKGDTTETVITHFDTNGNDSIQIWKYPIDTASWTFHWTYNDKNQLLSRHTSKGKINENDTSIYQYDSNGKLTKKTSLYNTFNPFDTLIYQNGIIKEVISYSPKEIYQRKKYEYYKDGRVKNITTYIENGQKLRTISYKYDSKKRKIRIKKTKYKTIHSPKKVEEIKRFQYTEFGSLRELEIEYFDRSYSETIYYNDDEERIKTIRQYYFTKEISVCEYERKTLHNSK